MKPFLCLNSFAGYAVRLVEGCAHITAAFRCNCGGRWRYWGSYWPAGGWGRRWKISSRVRCGRGTLAPGVECTGAVHSFPWVITIWYIVCTLLTCVLDFASRTATIGSERVIRVLSPEGSNTDLLCCLTYMIIFLGICMRWFIYSHKSLHLFPEICITASICSFQAPELHRLLCAVNSRYPAGLDSTTCREGKVHTCVFNVRQAAMCTFQVLIIFNAFCRERLQTPCRSGLPARWRTIRWWGISRGLEGWRTLWCCYLASLCELVLPVSPLAPPAQPSSSMMSESSSALSSASPGQRHYQARCFLWNLIRSAFMPEDLFPLCVKRMPADDPL